MSVSCSEVEVEEAAAEVVKDTVAAVKVRPIDDPQTRQIAHAGQTPYTYLFSFMYSRRPTMLDQQHMLNTQAIASILTRSMAAGLIGYGTPTRSQGFEDS